MNDSMDRFKEDYPEVFEKFLEMNRALAKIQRRLMRDQPRDGELESPDLGDEFPTMLELE